MEVFLSPKSISISSAPIVASQLLKLFDLINAWINTWIIRYWLTIIVILSNPMDISPKLLTNTLFQDLTMSPSVHLFLSGSLLARVTLHPARLLQWHKEPDI